MRKLFTILAAAVILMLVAPRESLAFFVPFNEFKIVGASGDESWSGTTIGSLPAFNLNETPFLYVKLPDNFLLWADIESDWKNPDGNLAGSADTTQWFFQGKKAWLSLSDWNDVQAPGTWTVDGSYKSLFCQTGTGTASFVVTPEPLAFLLYGIGGLPLAAHFIRRRKMLSV